MSESPILDYPLKGRTLQPLEDDRNQSTIISNGVTKRYLIILGCDANRYPYHSGWIDQIDQLHQQTKSVTVHQINPLRSAILIQRCTVKKDRLKIQQIFLQDINGLQNVLVFFLKPFCNLPAGHDCLVFCSILSERESRRVDTLVP